MTYLGPFLRWFGRALIGLAVFVAWMVWVVAEACSKKE